MESIEATLNKANSLACGEDVPGALSVLRELSIWDYGKLLLNVPQEYPCLAAVLPRMPSDEVQRNWTGNSGTALLAQSSSFVGSLVEHFERLTGRSLKDSKILDYGCGWGRHLRLMAAFSEPANLFGVDPWDESINICRQCGVLGHLAVSDYLPRSLPFDAIEFDLIYAYSVFTHLSEKTAQLVQRTIRSRINPDGIAAITIRPIDYWLLHGEVLPAGETIDNLRQTHLDRGFAFAPHNRAPIEGEITYGDASISIEYIKRNWTDWQVEATETAADPYQILVFLRPIR